MIEVRKSGFWWHLYTMIFDGNNLPKTHCTYVLLLIVSMILSLMILPITVLRLLYRLFTYKMNKINGYKVFTDYYGIWGGVISTTIFITPLFLSDLIFPIEDVGFIQFPLYWLGGFLMLFFITLMICTLFYIPILIKSKMKKGNIVIRQIIYTLRFILIRIKRRVVKFRRYFRKLKYRYCKKIKWK